ncbi:MAG: extensin family protein [Pseudomonadota bacterium]
MRFVLLMGLSICLADFVHAGAPAFSLRPVQRGGNVDVQSYQPLRPRPPAKSERQQQGQSAAVSSAGPVSSLRPVFRPDAPPPLSRAEQRLLRRGAVCGDISIQGEPVGRVPGRLAGCGIDSAVRISSVSGIGLSQRSVMDCGTARALKSWVDASAKPALRRKGGGLKSLRVAAHYVCRTRNHQPGAKISEHGKGRAIDISGFQLANGTEISVREGWTARRHSKALRRMHADACRHFGTVLGPQADRFHKDHFHFDTAQHRSGSYCR